MYGLYRKLKNKGSYRLVCLFLSPTALQDAKRSAYICNGLDDGYAYSVEKIADIK